MQKPQGLKDQNDSIFCGCDKFFKMAQFIGWHNISD